MLVINEWSVCVKRQNKKTQRQQQQQQPNKKKKHWTNLFTDAFLPWKKNWKKTGIPYAIFFCLLPIFHTHFIHVRHWFILQKKNSEQNHTRPGQQNTKSRLMISTNKQTYAQNCRILIIIIKNHNILYNHKHCRCNEMINYP